MKKNPTNAFRLRARKEFRIQWLLALLIMAFAVGWALTNYFSFNKVLRYSCLVAMIVSFAVRHRHFTKRAIPSKNAAQVEEQVFREIKRDYPDSPYAQY